MNCGEAECIWSTSKAIKVYLANYDIEVWIPQEAVHDDSDVWKKDQQGDLVIKDWFEDAFWEKVK